MKKILYYYWKLLIYLFINIYPFWVEVISNLFTILSTITQTYVICSIYRKIYGLSKKVIYIPYDNFATLFNDLDRASIRPK